MALARAHVPARAADPEARGLSRALVGLALLVAGCSRATPEASTAGERAASARAFDRAAFADPQIRAELARFVVVRFDLTAGGSAPEAGEPQRRLGELGGRGPFGIVIGGDGAEVARVAPYLEADPMLPLLRAAR